MKKAYTIEGDLEYIYYIVKALRDNYASAISTDKESILIYNHQIEKVKLEICVDKDKEPPNDTREY